jgi:hypothetical protein
MFPPACCLCDQYEVVLITFGAKNMQSVSPLHTLRIVFLILILLAQMYRNADQD